MTPPGGCGYGVGEITRADRIRFSSLSPVSVDHLHSKHQQMSKRWHCSLKGQTLHLSP